MRYRVTSPIFYGTHDADQRRYEPGELIDLNERDAAQLMASSAIEPYRPEAVNLSFNPLYPV